MATFSNMLVILEPQLEQQVALQRATEIMKFYPNAKITCFIAVYDFTYDLTSTLTVAEQTAMKNSIISSQEEWLNEQTKELQAKYPQVKTKVVWQRNIEEAILYELSKHHYDVLIKAAERHTMLDQFLFTPLDYALLRHTPIPMIIPRDHSWPDKANIIVTVNFTKNQNTQQDIFNVNLVRYAQILAKLINGNVHLVNIASPIFANGIMDIPGFTYDVLNDSLLANNRKELHNIAHKYRVPIENIHVNIGQIDDILPEIALDLDACAVLIGNYARSGLSAAILGNACEKILDQLNCDLIVIRKDYKYN